MTPTIESLQAELAEVNVALAKLTGKVNAYGEATKPKQPVTARVAVDKVYAFLDNYGMCGACYERNDKCDQYRFDSGNYAADTPEGRAYLERKQRRDLAKVRLERKRDELGGFVTTGGGHARLVPVKQMGVWLPWPSNAASEFAFEVDDKVVRVFLSSMSADLDIYFGEDNA